MEKIETRKTKSGRRYTKFTIQMADEAVKYTQKRALTYMELARALNVTYKMALGYVAAAKDMDLPINMIKEDERMKMLGIKYATGRKPRTASKTYDEIIRGNDDGYKNLMCGDLVMIGFDKVKITSIDTELNFIKGVYPCRSVEKASSSIDNITPIQLDDDILDIHFDRCGDTWVFSKNTKISRTDKGYEIAGLNVKYLNEVQQIIRIKEGKEIV